MTITELHGIEYSRPPFLSGEETIVGPRDLAPNECLTIYAFIRAKILSKEHSLKLLPIQLTGIHLMHNVCLINAMWHKGRILIINNSGHGVN